MSKDGGVKIEVVRTSKKDLRCTVCNKSGFSTTYKLNSHLFLHKAIPARYKCKYCTKEYYRSDEFSRHTASHLKQQKLYHCDHCDRGFVDKRNLILHLNIHDDLPRLSHLRYECTACEVSYCEERLLKYHIRKHHLNLEDTEPAHVTKNINETWIENVKNRKSCVQITKLKPNTLVIKRCKIRRQTDVKSDNDKNMFQKYIGSVFAMNDNYYSKAICDYCGKEMLKKSILTHIRERHLKLRRFACEECNRTFMRHYQLCLHNCGQNKRRKRKVEELPGIKF